MSSDGTSSHAHVHANDDKHANIADVIYVKKRSGATEQMSLSKITARFRNLADGQCGPYQRKELRICGDHIATRMCSQIYTGITTTLLDLTAADMCVGAALSSHVDFGVLASRLLMSNMHKSTKQTYRERFETWTQLELLSEDARATILRHMDDIESYVEGARDYMYDYFAIKTLERSYLFKKDDQTLERPQDMWIRTAVQIHGKGDRVLSDAERQLEGAAIQKCYHELSRMEYTHATPTLFNSCMRRPQLSSCYLVGMEDSIEGIFDTLKECALISKGAGGIGIDVSQIRSSGSYIGGTNGESNGLVPMLRVFNNASRYVDQGGGKRKGSFAIYLPIWHADVQSWLQLKNNQGDENSRARDLFYALMVSDVFMRRFENDEPWTLFSPSDVPELNNVHGAAFEAKYCEYEHQGRGRHTVPARTLWRAVVSSLIENGTPYVMFADACNAKSNQQNLGLIRSSNLCTEVVQYTSKEETAVCNLASVNLKRLHVPATPVSAFGVGTSMRLSTVTLVTRADGKCSYCDLAKMLLDRVGIAYSTVPMEQHPGRVGVDDPAWQEACRQHGARPLYRETKELRLGGRGNFHNVTVDDLTAVAALCDGLMEEDSMHGVEVEWRAKRPIVRAVGEFCKHYGGGEHGDDLLTILRRAKEDVEEAAAGTEPTDGSPWAATTARAIAEIEAGEADELFEHVYAKRYGGGMTTGKHTFPLLFVDGSHVGGYEAVLERVRGTVDYQMLDATTRTLVRNLNNVIDKTHYPVEKARRSNFRHRPIGIGVQGFADLLFKLRIPFASEDARDINKRVFATMYYAAVSESTLIAKERAELYAQMREDGVDPAAIVEALSLHPRLSERDAAIARGDTVGYPGAYSSFEGSPLANGRFQFDLWDDRGGDVRYDWDTLRKSVMEHGTYNSLLLAPMPTASTAQIFGNNECFEPITSNLYLRRTLSGEFAVVNRYLVDDLTELNVWSPTMKDRLIAAEGSLRDMEDVPKALRELYMSVWDMSQKHIIEMAADRGRYICQSQSMNLFLAEPSHGSVSSMLHYSWKKGLKTGVYYLRSKPRSGAQMFSIDPSVVQKANRKKTGVVHRSQAQDDECLTCGA